MDYLIHLLIIVCVYATLAVSLDLLTGHTGLASITHAAFYGVGAYASALLAVHYGTPFLLNLLVAMLFAASLSVIVSLPSLRLQEDYFVIATFGFQMILFSLFNNWLSLTRGPLGLAGIPRPELLGWEIRSPLAYLALACGLATGAWMVVRLLATSPLGRVLRAIREDEVFAKSLGKNTYRFKVIAFAVSAALAAAAGTVYAQYVTYIDPTSFTILESILVISMVIIGGAGSRWGAVVGALLLVLLPELLRYVGVPAAAAANTRQVFYGAALVAMMIYRPQGLVGQFDFRR